MGNQSPLDDVVRASPEMKTLRKHCLGDAGKGPGPM